MNEKNKNIIEYICSKCGWKWKPKNPNKKPIACPYCKSYHWNDSKPSK